MSFSTKLSEDLKRIAGEQNISENVPMSDYTTFRCGGPAKRFVTPENAEALKETVSFLWDLGEPFFILGRGSNLLVSDSGYDGTVISMRGIRNLRVEGTGITAEAGVMLSELSSAALQNGLTGLEFASGIPGTVGGGVIMNAGAYGYEIRDVLTSAEVLRQDGSVKIYPREELAFSYRYSALQENDGIVISAYFSLRNDDPQAIRERMDELNGRRREKQPLEYPSAGSAFKRPPGNFAAALIDSAGLRGFRIGGAGVSEKHTGFVVNYGNATAEDVYRVLDTVREKVYENSGILLEQEVKLLGRF